ncbi:MAG: TldD/PmbA family protein, partial [Muribaculum sp.]|nr:TldD/PmbA family protein [Candidatus Merdivivens faecigallinarum]
PMLSGLKYEDCATKAYERATARLNPKKIKSGKYIMVVENYVASRLFAPIMAALNGMAIEQHNSFLTDSLGKRVFPEWLDVIDRPHVKGAPGSRLFDSEGVATKDCDIISRGTIGMYFINSYASRKLGMPQTVESASRPVIVPFDRTSGKGTGHGISSLDYILRQSGSGILVTGFNGGNSNPVTGAFSFGIEGFRFENGEILYPISEMLITGDILSLWAKSLFAGTDPLESLRWQVPTLAFEDVDFNG